MPGNATPQDLVGILSSRGDITDTRIHEAFAAVPRHLFLPGVPLEQVYSDQSIVVCTDTSDGVWETTMPSMIAHLLQMLDVKPGHNVLEIGTGTGYGTALLRHLVGDEGKLTSLELQRNVARRAEDTLMRAGMNNICVVNVDGAYGYAPRAAYDRIAVTVGIWDMPRAWVRQLKPRGVIVAPMWLDGLQVTARFEVQPDGRLTCDRVVPSAFSYIRGTAAGPQVRKRVGSTGLMILADGVDQIDTAALSVLLATDYEDNHLSSALNTHECWYGFLPYLMINEPADAVFTLYTVTPGRQAFGIEGEGFAVFTAASAAFVPYYGEGFVHCFAGADAFLEIETHLDRWREAGRPTIRDLRLELIPREFGAPRELKGKVYPRHQHYLHVWLEDADETRT
jgi:protein-L-isoaspartate(D-aspartate) O-methyltransferase